MIRSSRQWLKTLHVAAQAGKKTILRNYSIDSRTTIVKKGVGGDFTLKIDEASEKAILNSLNQTLGKNQFVFVSEELGEIGPTGDRSMPVVICDPLDGSHNAQVGIPFFAVSLCVLGTRRGIGNAENRTFGRVDVALIASIRSEDEYSAAKNEGAYVNGKRVSSSSRNPSRINTLLIETGDVDYMKRYLTRRLTKKLVYKTRILGSAALSYCLLADGSVDALIFAQPGGARTIDSPAGYLIAKESGCKFIDLSGKVKNTDDITVGFESKINLAGAPSTKTLEILRRLVRTPD